MDATPASGKPNAEHPESPAKTRRMDVLLLNKSSARCVKRLLSALHGFDVDVVESWPELTRRMHEGCDACAVV